MRRGIVMEKHHDYIVVMRKDGAFQKGWPLEEAAVGMEISYRPITENRHSLFDYISKKQPIQIAAVACLLLLLIPFYFLYDQDRTYAYVNITINPDLELEIDDQLNVKSIAPLNEDAESFLPELSDVKGEHLENVIQQIMNKSEEADMLENGKNILAGVSYVPDTHEVSVTEAIDEYFLDRQGWEIITLQIPRKIWEDSRNNDDSMNEMMATNLIESERSTGDKEGSSTAESPVDENEREIIHSFYNNRISDSDTPDREKNAEQSEHNEPSNEDIPKSNDESNESSERSDQDGKGDESKHPGEKNSSQKNTDQNKQKAAVNKPDREAGNNGKAKGHDKAKHNGKARGHDKAKHNGRAQEHDRAKQNNGKAKGHSKMKQNNGKPGSNHAQHNGHGPK